MVAFGATTAPVGAQQNPSTLPLLAVEATAPKKKAAEKRSPTKQTPPAAQPGQSPTGVDPAGLDGTADPANVIGIAAKSALDARAGKPNAIVVIEGAQLNQFNDLSIGDAIRRLPGVTFPTVNRSRDIKLRGIGKEYTQILLDGRPLLDGDSSRNMEVDRIPASFIERIEITRSPLASMESQGAAGTVNIITRRNFGASGGQITVGAGRVEGNGVPGEFTAWQGGEVGSLRYFIGGGYQRRFVQESANTYIFGANGTTPNRGNLVEQHRKFDEHTFLSRFEWKMDPANTIIFAPSYLKTTEARDQHDRRLSTDQTYIDRDTHEVRGRIRETYGSYLEWRHDLSAVSSTRAFFDYQKGREDTTRDSTQTTYNALGVITSGPTVQTPRFVPIALERWAPGAAFRTQFGGHTFETGVGLAHTSRAENEERGGVPYVSRNYKIGESIYHAFISDSFSVLGRDRLTVGLRLEHSQTESVDFAGSGITRDATDLNPSLQYKVSAAPNIDFRLGVARTLRRPDLRELTPTTVTNGGSIIDPDTRGNPNTLPERIWGADVGVDMFLFGRTGLLAANVFGRSIEDKIERTLTTEAGRVISTPRNAGDGNLYGVELESRVPLNFISVPGITLWANATAMKSSLTDQQTGQTRRFAEQPNLVTNIGLDYYVPVWRTTFGVSYNRTFAYDQDIMIVGGTRQQTEFSALDRLDASMRIALTDKAAIIFSATNLLRAVDDRTLTTRDTAGTITARTHSMEPSPSVYYARLAFDW
jgi:iron complex outermembrane receptor protein